MWKIIRGHKAITTIALYLSFIIIQKLFYSIIKKVEIQNRKNCYQQDMYFSCNTDLLSLINWNYLFTKK